MKNHYWLKFHEGFFESDKITYLESQPNGEKYIILWQKLLLLCIRKSKELSLPMGILKFTERLPYDYALLAKTIRVEPEVVKCGIDLFIQCDMMDVQQDGTIYIEAINNIVGKPDSSAERVKKFRDKKKSLELPYNSESACNVTVTPCNDHREEIEKEEEIEKDAFSKEKYLNLWNTITYKLPKIQEITQGRATKLAARIKAGMPISDVVARLEASSFATGANERGWRASFDWVIANDNNWVKVMEGKYDDKDSKPLKLASKMRDINHNSTEQYSEPKLLELQAKFQRKWGNYWHTEAPARVQDEKGAYLASYSLEAIFKDLT